MLPIKVRKLSPPSDRGCVWTAAQDAHRPEAAPDLQDRPRAGRHRRRKR